MTDDEDDFVEVLYDGSVRELAPDQKAYLSEKFGPGDSGRPFIKSCYDERNGWGRLDGYLLRNLVPPNIPIERAVLPGGNEG